MSFRVSFALGLLVLAGFAVMTALPVARGQTLASTAAFSGTVSDSSGARTANAGVLTNAENGAILGDGIWMDVTPVIKKQGATLNMNYVLLEGTFSAGERGHPGMWSGTIKQVRRAQPWRPPKK